MLFLCNQEIQSVQIYIKFFLRKITHRRMKKIDFVDYIGSAQCFKIFRQICNSCKNEVFPAVSQL